METVQKRKIEAIYPLTTMQQGLLFHHLTSNDDRGFLHVQCTINGNLDVVLFKSAWQKAVERHAILRTSVHWKKIEKPVQLVRPEAQMFWTVFDWSGISETEQKSKLKTLKESDTKNGIDLEKAPLSNIVLVQTSPQTFYLLWQCHHLLLDGWSSSIILQDVNLFYNALCDKQEVRLAPIPSYKSYLSWLKRNSLDEAVLFWKSELANFKPITSFIEKEETESSKVGTYQISLSENESASLERMVKKAHITPNTLFMGIWALLLARYSKSDDVVFGTTVSGRSSTFPNIHLMTGMFMNVIPVRSRLDAEKKAVDCFKTIQTQQQKARNFEHMALVDILTSIDWPGGVPLFESLFVFENFPLKGNSTSHIEINDFHSGVTTTYPLTLIVKPGPCFTIDLLIDQGKISTGTSEWFVASLKQLISEITVRPDDTTTSLLDGLDDPPAGFIKMDEESLKDGVDRKFIAPSTPTEIKLVALWEKAFGFSPIGVEDNFFELGADSLLSIQIISSASKLGIKLTANQLFSHQTISELSKSVSTDIKELKPWEYLVEIRSKGSKAPLFCLHTGGSHFFFYNILAKYLNPDRPIYAVHASGLKDEAKLHLSVEEMAADFVNEIKRVQPDGPYHIMAYCFSTAVGLEIAHILNKKSERVHYIVVDTSSINQNLYAISNTGSRISRIGRSIMNNPVKTVKRAINKRMEFYIKPAIAARFGNEDQKRVESLRNNNVKIYGNYKWQSFDGTISLLLTEKSYNPDMNEFIVDSWEKIAEKGLKIIHMKGHHYTLFSEPDVEHTAMNLENCMQEFEANGK